MRLLDRLNNLSKVFQDWWDGVKKPEPDGCRYLERNIDSDRQFDHDPAAADVHLADFIKRLTASTKPTAKEKARQAIKGADANDREVDPACMLCAGREAALPGEIRNVVPLAVLMHPGPQYGYYVPGTLPGDSVEEMAELLDNDHHAFHTHFVPNARYRGRFPLVFWAAAEDLVQFENDLGRAANMTQFRRFLGIDVNPHPGPGIMLRLDDDTVVRRVPTGFDAFDHEHFLPPDNDLPGTVVSHGRTKDLNDPEHGTGGREVVTVPVPLRQLNLVRVVDGDDSGNGPAAPPTLLVTP